MSGPTKKQRDARRRNLKKYDRYLDSHKEVGHSNITFSEWEERGKPSRQYPKKKRSLKERASGYTALAKHHLRKLGIKSKKTRKRKKSAHRSKRRSR